MADIKVPSINIQTELEVDKVKVSSLNLQTEVNFSRVKIPAISLQVEVVTDLATIKNYNASTEQWESHQLKLYNGSSWQTKTIKRWSGSAWV